MEGASYNENSGMSIPTTCILLLPVTRGITKCNQEDAKTPRCTAICHFLRREEKDDHES
jgi:hypothetical protein